MDTVIWNGQHFTAYADGESGVVPLLHAQVCEGLKFNGVRDAVIDPDFEITLPEGFIPANAVQQIPDRFHEMELNTKALRTQSMIRALGAFVFV